MWKFGREYGILHKRKAEVIIEGKAILWLFVKYLWKFGREYGILGKRKAEVIIVAKAL